MGYRSLAECVRDLESTGQLVVIDQEVDPYLEVAAIQRRVYQAGGPALLFRRAKGTAFPLLGNLFGTLERSRFLFRDTLDAVRRLVELKADPGALGQQSLAVPRRPAHALAAPAAARQAGADPGAPGRRSTELPQIQCWPMDGGPFITLPQVYTEDPDRPGLARSNLGMYRVQLAGNEYEPDREVGLHYQIHRGIGVHHAAAIRRGEPLRVNVFVGGPPAMTVAAVMPLPEGLPELAFAGALGGRRVAMVAPDGGLPMPAEADFVISGTIDPTRRKPEGPFGDHLGYYSLTHDFPVLRVDRVYHRDGAIWPFTSVGRPPQEDTSFGALIHELTGPIIPSVIPGVRAVHAVDAAGVHPLLLAIASERYVPDADVAPAAGDPDHRQRDPRPGAAVAGEVPLDRRPRGRPRPRHPRHPGVLPPRARSGSTGRTTCTSRPGRRSTRSTTRATGSTRGRRSSSRPPGRCAGRCPTELPGGLAAARRLPRAPRGAAGHPGRPGAGLSARRRRRAGLLPVVRPGRRRSGPSR